MNKEVGFSSQQHFQLLWCLMPHCLGRHENAYALGLEKYL